MSSKIEQIATAVSFFYRAVLVQKKAYWDELGSPIVKKKVGLRCGMGLRDERCVTS